MINKWVSAARLQTLPLSFGSIILGSCLAVRYGHFSWPIFSLALLTTLLLQILSNYANDLGDTLHGADAERSEGPARMVQLGLITTKQMRTAVVGVGVAAFLSGVMLLLFSNLSQQEWLAFLGLGIVSIAAAYLYTNGWRPYGYLGLGDVFVFIFFGLVGVLGPFYLMTHTFETEILLPASAAGFLATGVLNLNNIRDIVTDRRAGKLSIPARIGFRFAKVYQLVLLFGAVCCFVIYGFYYTDVYSIFLLLIAPIITVQARRFYHVKSSQEAGLFLPRLAISAFFADLVFGLFFLYG